MAIDLELPNVYVEGQSDLHAIVHLLARYNLALDKDSGPVLIKDSDGVRSMLGAMRTAVRASTNRSVGFVLDADESISGRWQAVKDQLSGLDVTLPDSIPASGYIGVVADLNVRLGVWIMPDNVSETGNLEQFIENLIPHGDVLYPLACSSTDTAKRTCQRFRNQDLVKAQLHCWLAWQSDPGMSFGLALRTSLLAHDSPEAQRFVEWFRRLFADVLGGD